LEHGKLPVNYWVPTALDLPEQGELAEAADRLRSVAGNSADLVVSGLQKAKNHLDQVLKGVPEQRQRRIRAVEAYVTALEKELHAEAARQKVDTARVAVLLDQSIEGGGIRNLLKKMAPLTTAIGDENTKDTIK
jgi:hypothetical protein